MRPQTEKFSEALSRLFLQNDDYSDKKQVERANIELATRFYRALGENDLHSAKECLSEDVYHKLHGPEDFGPSGEDRGPEAMLSHMASVFSLLEDQTPRALQVIAQGHNMTIVYRDSGRIKQSGVEYDVTGVHLLEFHDKKIVRLENLFDTASFERAIKHAEAVVTS